MCVNNESSQSCRSKDDIRFQNLYVRVERRCDRCRFFISKEISLYVAGIRNGGGWLPIRFRALKWIFDEYGRMNRHSIVQGGAGLLEAHSRGGVQWSKG